MSRPRLTIALSRPLRRICQSKRPRQRTASLGIATSCDGAVEAQRCKAAHSCLWMDQSLFWQVSSNGLSNKFIILRMTYSLHCSNALCGILCNVSVLLLTRGRRSTSNILRDRVRIGQQHEVVQRPARNLLFSSACELYVNT